MDLTKAAALVLSSKKAIFQPDSGSPLSGRYCWRDRDQIIYLHYEGVEDELLVFELTDLEDFLLPPFESLMQKHIISFKKLPDMLLERTDQLIRDIEQNKKLLHNKNQVIPISRLEFLFYQEALGYALLYYDAGWRLSLDYPFSHIRYIQKLWKEPGIHARTPSIEITYLLLDQLEIFKKYWAMVQKENYALFKESEVWVYFKDRFFKFERDYWEVAPEKTQAPPNVVEVSKTLFLENLLMEQNKKGIHTNVTEGLKKFPEEYQKLLHRLIQ